MTIRSHPPHIVAALALIGQPRGVTPTHCVMSAADATRPQGMTVLAHRQAVYRAYRKQVAAQRPEVNPPQPPVPPVDA